MKKFLLKKAGLSDSNVTMKDKNIIVDFSWNDINSKVRESIPYVYDLSLAKLSLNKAIVGTGKENKIQIIFSGMVSAFTFEKSADITVQLTPYYSNGKIFLKDLYIVDANIPGYQYSGTDSNPIFQALVKFLSSKLDGYEIINIHDQANFSQNMMISAVDSILITPDGVSCHVNYHQVVKHMALNAMSVALIGAFGLFFSYGVVEAFIPGTAEHGMLVQLFNSTTAGTSKGLQHMADHPGETVGSVAYHVLF